MPRWLAALGLLVVAGVAALALAGRGDGQRAGRDAHRGVAADAPHGTERVSSERERHAASVATSTLHAQQRLAQARAQLQAGAEAAADSRSKSTIRGGVASSLAEVFAAAAHSEAGAGRVPAAQQPNPVARAAAITRRWQGQLQQALAVCAPSIATAPTTEPTAEPIAEPIAEPATAMSLQRVELTLVHTDELSDHELQRYRIDSARLSAGEPVPSAATNACLSGARGLLVDLPMPRSEAVPKLLREELTLSLPAASDPSAAERAR
ncbi:hypothetical protein [Haliangium ochraceum]|uniref:Uncharacterized protein n=1 Tax=Haliangium ochraceum (strain DSM 14365 / JCM 11303 / SMP-2) TaxID=502025 RepID=D0LWY0_HALO1|nr:hypothetical protein [Haliangium ochraceum]ACY14227.1 hypothetical protein Hoch_1677 [Haliangium ochraceum DSM 14365]